MWISARAALALALALGATDSNPSSARRRVAASHHDEALRAHERAAESVTAPIMVRLQSGAFPGGDQADAAVHIPPGFDATERPGLVVYFHGWQGCIAAVLALEDVACDDAGTPHPASNLSREIDAARVNALLVAVELRVDSPTGEPGQLAMPAGAHALLSELLTKLAQPLGTTLSVDALDRIVLIAHSGGYQAAAAVIAQGDLPQITEVDLLDALYGADDVFARWIADDVVRFDARLSAGLRFVNLYTCCGGTLAASRSMARATEEALARAGLSNAVYDDDGNADLDRFALVRPIVFKRVSEAHGQLPHAYVRELVEAAGFAPIH